MLSNPRGVLTPHQHAVASQVLLEEERSRPHLVIYLSGAHAYGFPSPDSDLDLKAAHTESTHRLLGLGQPPAHASRVEIVRDVEIDYTSNELRAVLAGVLDGNGNYIERFLGELVLYSTPALEELRPMVQRALSRRVHRHYRGFATQQRLAFETAEKPTAKKLLYVLRTALTGVHLLRTGELVTDLPQLLEPYGLPSARELIEIKRAGERVPLDRALVADWRPRLDDLFDLLDRARLESILPEQAPNRAELDAWLVEHRLRQSRSHLGDRAAPDAPAPE
ncbi:MAG TPA: nucleotidyltransferase domain-containing protein [Kofleriaceae bacterium]|nr:nucleotidyltransferase domain-containing protein [Kofleriaceae bacterium]